MAIAKLLYNILLHVDIALCKPSDRIRLNSFILLGNVNENLKCIHWIYV